MSYLGKVDMNDADIKHYSLTGSTLTTVDIGWVPPSEQSLRVTINGVVQQGGTFSLSGSNLTLGGALVATDDLEVVGIQSVGNIITPADDSVSTAKLADDAVTTAKILDDNVTLAKMASGTDGNLITYDASGDPAHVATGSATHVLTSNGAGAAPTFQAPASGGFIGYTVYTGNATWLKSTNSPTKVVVEVQGSGGGGGGSYNGYPNSGGHGGAGGYCRKFIDVSSVTQALIVVGAAGTAGAHAGAGGAGNTSSWIDTASGGSSTVVGAGGTGGAASGPSHGAGGTGGAATGGDINIPGSNGTTSVRGPKTSPGSFLGLTNPITGPLDGSGFDGLGYGAQGIGGCGNGVYVGGAGAPGVVIVWEYA